MERRAAQPTFRDGLTADLGGPRSAAFFERAETLIDWGKLAESLRELTPPQPRGGRPFWPLSVMIRCVLLQKWFNLSDPGLEEMLRDRLSFRRFAGLPLDDATPDETSFVVFRGRLREAGKASALFDAVLASLRERGLVLEEGRIIDATIVDAPQGSKRPDGSSTRDRCASYTKNHGTPRHGYKAHQATDTRGIVTGYVFDSAKAHDSKHADALLEGEQTAGYADSAYRSEARVAALEAKGVEAMITHKRVRGQKELTPGQKAHNRACSVVRAVVEHPRAWMAAMGYLKARYRGLARNALDYALTAAAYNLKRSFSLLGRPLSPPRPHRHNGVAVSA
jgi:IS5 family transposase